jgi:hypothetical protein
MNKYLLDAQINGQSAPDFGRKKGKSGRAKSSSKSNADSKESASKARATTAHEDEIEL